MALREGRLVERELELGGVRDFYTRELGAQGSPLYHDPSSGRRAAFLDFGGVEVIEPAAAVERPPSWRPPGPTRIAFALGSADAVDHLSARLAAAGHPLVEPPTAPGKAATWPLSSTPTATTSNSPSRLGPKTKGMRGWLNTTSS